MLLRGVHAVEITIDVSVNDRPDDLQTDGVETPKGLGFVDVVAEDDVTFARI